MQFSIFLALVFLAEIGIGIAGYYKHEELSGILEKGFNKTLDSYATDKGAQEAWNLVQSEMVCCGIKGPEDWEPIYKNDTVPRACCHRMPVGVNKCTREYASTEGCFSKLSSYLGSKSLILAGIGIGLAIVQVRGQRKNCVFKVFKVEHEELMFKINIDTEPIAVFV